MAKAKFIVKNNLGISHKKLMQIKDWVNLKPAVRSLTCPFASGNPTTSGGYSTYRSFVDMCKKNNWICYRLFPKIKSRRVYVNSLKPKETIRQCPCSCYSAISVTRKVEDLLKLEGLI